MKNLIKFGCLLLVIVITILILFGCGVSAKLKHAQKLIKEAEASGAVIKHDTTYVDKLIPIKGQSTIVTQTLKGKDTTIYVYQDKIKVKEVFKHNTLKIYVQCPDSVLHEKEAIANNETINCPPESNFWKSFAIGVSLLLLAVVYMLIKRL